jgi:3-oxoacyl-[acyl-carrier-protein] synthase II
MNEPIQPRRVVITGMSLACALGFELEEYWRRLLAGECGIRRLPDIADDSPLPTKYAGWIDDEALAAALPRYLIDDPDRANQLALYAAGRALEDAGLSITGETPSEMDVIAGSGHGNASFHNEAISAYVRGGYRKIRPTTVVRLMFNRPGNLISIRYKLTGVSYTVSAACATGSIAVGTAFHQVRFGLTDSALAVCADSAMDTTSIAAWNRLGVLTKHPDPATASRPFDSQRNGLVMGEGAAGFVLETLEAAQARGARILGEILGYGTSSDAAHIVVPEVAGQVKAIRSALKHAGVAPEEINYVNAHGTATKPADTAEAASLIEALGEAGRKVPVSNTKAQLGHLMGATAGVELVTTLLAMQKGEIPPCRNLDHPDPECPLNFVRNEALKRDVRVALKNSFAFGGTNSALILKRW